ncbi:MAG: phosphatidate cytidylyltransferase [Prevotella sp.]|nr:phosphatidate cytidylyltransferase [Prevotella sp.]
MSDRNSKLKNFIVRAITGILFAAAIVVCFIKPIAMVGLFALFTGLTLWEYCGLANSIENVSINRFISTVAGVYFFLAMAGFCSGTIQTAAVFIPYLLTLVYLFISEIYLNNSNAVNDWAYTTLGQMYIALPFSTINVLAFNATPNGAITFNYIIPLSIFIFLWLNDTGAYLCGTLLGKHKLFPRISPAKSWEGSIGGAILVTAGAATIGYYTYDVYALSPLNIAQWVGLGLVVVFFGTWGDLVESLFKRTIGVKDSGSILPGHGGMLDRFDSSLMAMPAAVVYLYTLTLL